MLLMTGIERSTRRVLKAATAESATPTELPATFKHIAINAENNPAILTDPRFVPATQRIVTAVATLGPQVLTINFPKPEDEDLVFRRVMEMNLSMTRPRDGVPSLFLGDADGLTVILKFGSDGRGEIVRAARRAIDNAETDMDQEIFSKYRDIPGIPDVDIAYYTGETDPTLIQFRNTDIWGEAYAEVSASQDPFLEQTEAHIDNLARDFVSRDRRFGGLSTSSNGADSE